MRFGIVEVRELVRQAGQDRNDRGFMLACGGDFGYMPWNYTQAGAVAFNADVLQAIAQSHQNEHIAINETVAQTDLDGPTPQQRHLAHETMDQHHNVNSDQFLHDLL